jgi:endonuclease/exonuclease/phosphatase family metal-dependent hydrolase
MTRSVVVAFVVAVSLFRLAGYFTEPRLSDAEIHAVAGEPARVSHGGGQPRSLTIATWNIERGVKFDAIVGTLRMLAPDVLLLQEVDRFCKRSGYRDVASDLAAALGMNWVSAGEFQEVGEADGTKAAVTGQAILSRQPIVDPAVIVFDAQSSLRWRLNPFQPRRGGRLALRARTAGLLVYSVHLESGGEDRQRSNQLGQILSDQSRHRATRVVIAGDFNNAVAFQSFMFAGLAPAGFVDALGTAPRQTSMNHRHPIDWMFVKGAHGAGRVERVAGASDHYPLIATLSR